MTYKTLIRQTVRCNSIPDAIQFKGEEELLPLTQPKPNPNPSIPDAIQFKGEEELLLLP